MRSKGNINVVNVALKYGGGGHINAAGFDVKGNPEEIIKDICRELNVNEKSGIMNVFKPPGITFFWFTLFY